MRNLKVDPLFKGARVRSWPRDKVYTEHEVHDVCRKTGCKLVAAPNRRFFVIGTHGRPVTRLVATTRSASSVVVETKPATSYIITL